MSDEASKSVGWERVIPPAFEGYLLYVVDVEISRKWWQFWKPETWKEARAICEMEGQTNCLKQYREALEASVVAIDDWLNTYADDLCDAGRVKEARQRIGEFGTIGYIAHVQEANRKALHLPPKDTQP